MKAAGLQGRTGLKQHTTTTTSTTTNDNSGPTNINTTNTWGLVTLSNSCKVQETKTGSFGL